VIETLVASPWPGILTFAFLFTSDSSLTMTCARMYREGVRDHIGFDGSFELTPFHQVEVDALRRFGPRFFLALILGATVVAAMWWMSVSGETTPATYEFGLGMIVLLQLAVHVRHLRNLSLFRSILAGGAISGRIEYARSTLLTNSAVELIAFGALYAIVSLVVGSMFLAGGALGCAVLGGQQLQLARRASARPAMV
jgi:hypothetical protein